MHIYEANENVMEKKQSKIVRKNAEGKINEKTLSKAYKKQKKIT